jgi:hypothetical protein
MKKTHCTCSIIIEHNCSSKVVVKTHRNMTFATQEMYDLIVDNLNYEPRMIFRHIQRTDKYFIGYMKA